MTRAPRSTPPPGPGGEPDIDVVPGDPPVPITIWRTPAGDDHASIPPRLAQRLVSAYSQPGEVVVDLTDDRALTAAAAAGGRRHHRGWFTDAATLLVATATPPQPGDAYPGTGRTAVAGRRRRRRRGGDADAVDLAAWFGDDLADPDLPPAGRAPGAAPATAAVRGVTALVVGCWPLHPVGAGHRARLSGLLRAGATLLRPAGCLVLAVQPSTGRAAGTDPQPATPTAAPAPPEDFGPLIAAAAAEAGLGYLQHIVAVRADVDGDQFVYYATDAELLALTRDAATRRVAHLRVHADLLVFTPRPTTAGSRRGGARG